VYIESLRKQWSLSFSRSFLHLPYKWSGSRQKPRRHHAFALHFNLSPLLEGKFFVQFQKYLFRDVYLSRFAVRFHAACGVHGVAPEVVAEFARADNARYCRASMDANTQLEISPVGVRKASSCITA
jgi:hypothetical protein